MQQQENRPKPGSSKKKQLNSYARYGAMGLQMAAIMVLGTWFGYWLDKKMGNVKFPAFTLVFSLLSVFAAIYYFVKDFIKKK